MWNEIAEKYVAGVDKEKFSAAEFAMYHDLKTMAEKFADFSIFRATTPTENIKAYVEQVEKVGLTSLAICWDSVFQAKLIYFLHQAGFRITMPIEVERVGLEGCNFPRVYGIIMKKQEEK